LLAIAGLGNETLAARLAELYRTDGAIMALNKMVSSGNVKASDAAEQSLGAIFKTPMRSIVQIACNGKIFGAGFFIRTDGHIVTTQNVISGGGDITIITSQGALPARLIAQDSQANLAVLKVDGTFFTVMPIHQASSADLLSEVFLIGHDPYVGLVVSPGKVVGQNRYPEYPGSELINVNVLVPRSYGGAAAINREGAFIGIVVLLKLDDVGNATTAYVLPAASLVDFVKNMIPQQDSQEQA
jgi:S1-C subfamily serine protease